MSLLILALAVGLFVVGGTLGALAYGLYSLAPFIFGLLHSVTERGADTVVPPATYRTSSLAR